MNHGVADLNRPVSPLLHDYKPSAKQKPAKSRALQWFAVGLGIPLLGVALINGLSTSDPKPPESSEPVMTAVDADPVPAGHTDPLVLVSSEAEPVLPPPPEFEKLTLTVGRGAATPWKSCSAATTSALAS